MSGSRPIVKGPGGLSREAANGDGIFQVPVVKTVSADANYTITATDIAGGVLAFTGFTAGRNLTTDTAANIIAAFPQLNVGEAVVLQVGISVAYAGTLVAGTDVTLAGKATVVASGSAFLYFTKTSATTVTLTVI